MTPDCSDWLQRIVDGEIEAYAFPAPAATPEVWPEARGRGVLLGEPGKRPMTNADTVRFMAPGISTRWPGGYLLYTDEFGGYVDPRTGASRFAKATQGQSIEAVPTQGAPATELRRWVWPREATHEPAIDDALDVFVGRPIMGAEGDEVGLRLVLDLGDLPEPRIYVDLNDPECLDRHGHATAISDRAIVGTAITDLLVAGGSLELRLSDGGVVLRCSADDGFEAWQLVAAGVGLWVCAYGSDLAAFSFARQP